VTPRRVVDWHLGFKETYPFHNKGRGRKKKIFNLNFEIKVDFKNCYPIYSHYFPSFINVSFFLCVPNCVNVL
jgi:hypothetical protein